MAVVENDIISAFDAVALTTCSTLNLKAAGSSRLVLPPKLPNSDCGEACNLTSMPRDVGRGLVTRFTTIL